MALFSYQVKNSKGQIVEGMVEAETETIAADILIDKGFTILSLEEKKLKKWLEFLKSLQRVSSKDIVIFARQLSVMISANVPVVQSLRILVKQTTNPVLKVVVAELADEVEGGSKFSTALEKYPEIFDDFFINIIRSGETSGKLDEVLNYLAEQKEKDYDLMSKIKGAMIYPVFIISALIIVAVIVMIFVMPKLTAVLKESGAKLPWMTKALIGTSDFMVNFWWLLLLITVGLVVGLKLFIKTPNGRYRWDLIKIKLPIFGKLFQRIYLIRFTRSLSTLTRGGVDLVSSLKIVSGIVGNEVYHSLIRKTISQVEDGNPVATEFLKSKEVPIMVSQMLDIGEQTGKLEDVLDKVSEFYSREVANLVNNLVTALEPLIMMVMGLAVGVMVAAVIVPMFNLAASL